MIQVRTLPGVRPHILLLCSSPITCSDPLEAAPATHDHLFVISVGVAMHLALVLVVVMIEVLLLLVPLLAAVLV